MSSISFFTVLLFAVSYYVLCSSKTLALNNYQLLKPQTNPNHLNRQSLTTLDSRQKRSQPEVSEFRERNELLEDLDNDNADGYFEQLSPSAYNQLVNYLWSLIKEPPKPRPRLGRRNSPDTRQADNLVHEERGKPSKVRALYPPRLGKRTQESCY